MSPAIVRQTSVRGMTTIEVDEVRDGGRLARVAREWWPVPIFIAGAVVAQVWLLTSRYQVGGHAAEHLGSASAPFLAAAMLAILFWATPSARRQADVILAAAAWFAANMAVMLGNVRVVDDLVEAGHGHTPTGAVPDIADHSLANSSIWFAVAAAVVLVASCRWRRHVGNIAAVGAGAAMFFPPWIIPGAGVVVLTVVRCVARGKQLRGRRVRALHHSPPAPSAVTIGVSEN